MLIFYGYALAGHFHSHQGNGSISFGPSCSVTGAGPGGGRQTRADVCADLLTPALPSGAEATSTAPDSCDTIWFEALVSQVKVGQAAPKPKVTFESDKEGRGRMLRVGQLSPNGKPRLSGIWGDKIRYMVTSFPPSRVRFSTFF